MMISTSNFLNPEPDTTGHKINSIKLDFAKIAFTAPTNSPFTQCQHCPAILTQEVNPPTFRIKKCLPSRRTTSSSGPAASAKSKIKANSSTSHKTTTSTPSERIVTLPWFSKNKNHSSHHPLCDRQQRVDVPIHLLQPEIRQQPTGDFPNQKRPEPQIHLNPSLKHPLQTIKITGSQTLIQFHSISQKLKIHRIRSVQNIPPLRSHRAQPQTTLQKRKSSTLSSRIHLLQRYDLRTQRSKTKRNTSLRPRRRTVPWRMAL